MSFTQLSDSIAFAFIAGVGPLVGLHAAWIVGLATAIFGSRPGMVNGATGVRAAVIAPYVKEFGVGFLFYIILVISVYQFLAGVFGLARFVRMVPRTVMMGFVCGLAVIMAMGQIPQFKECPPLDTLPDGVCTPDDKVFIDDARLGIMITHIVVVVLTIAFGVPALDKLTGVRLPATLIAILLCILIEHGIVRPTGGPGTPTIGEVSTVSGGFPKLFFLDPQYDVPPFTWAVLQKVAWPAFVAAAAGGVEAVLTMNVIDEMTETENPRPNQQLIALSIGNFVGGLLGTMGGGATIGPSIVNIGAGANGKYKISTIVAGLCMLLYVLVAEPVVALVPTSALVGVMCIVVYQTFEWSAIPIVLTTLLPQSVREHKWLDSARKIKRSDAIVIILVTVLTLVTDLMIATLAGVLLSAAVYAWQTGQQVDVVHSYVWEPRPDTADAAPDTPGATTPPAAPKDSAVVHVDTPKADEADSTVEETTGVVDTASDTSSAATEDGAGEGEGDVVPADAPPCPGPNFRLVKQYHLTGPLFFASAPALSKLFTPKADPSVVELHMHAYSKVQVHDFSGMDMLNSVGEKYAKAGKVFRVMRLNAAASKMVSKADKLAEHFSYHEEAVPLQDSADFEAGAVSGAQMRQRSAHAQGQGTHAEATVVDGSSAFHFNVESQTVR